MYACYRSDCYAVGFKLGPAATLNQNPNFESASIKVDDDPIDSIRHIYSISDYYGMNYLHRFVKLKSELCYESLPTGFCQPSIMPVWRRRSF